MKTTGEFREVRKEITVKKNRPIRIAAFGDIHYGAPLHSARTFTEYLKPIIDDPDCYCFLMGDYMDFMSTSERKGMGSACFHESTETTIDKLARGMADELIEILEPLKGRILGMIEGNHYYEFPNGMTTTQYMCDKLDCSYLGVLCMMRVAMKDTRGDSLCSVDIYAHHGTGGGGLVGGSANSLSKMAGGAIADIYLMGHNHKMHAHTEQRIYMDGRGKIRHRSSYYVRTGAFLKAYENGKRSYIADACGNPCTLGAPIIQITPMRTRKEGKQERHPRIQVTI